MHLQISSKPIVQACNDFEVLLHTSKGEQKTFQVSIYSVHMLVSEVKLSQTFIQWQVQEIFTQKF